ncbi:MAG: metal ABC transporter ATP-binding protein [Tannerellaceae bacterium]|jgi:zinc transport system ATP-binding protein|nr:metal ABC transporter ATP-binding protein [Tannerellaceae bacterium]
MNNKQIEIENLSAAYDGQIVLHDVSLTVRERDFLGVVGPNGGGKTTLLKVILGLLPPVAGHLRFYRDNQAVASLKMGYLPQMNPLDRNFPISVREVVASGLMSEKPLFHSFLPEQNRQIDLVVEQMGLETLSRRPIGKLSGGQFQRTLLGRAIVSRPQVLIMDEPGSYVDKQFESRFYPLLKDLNRECTIILVSHDIRTVASLTDHTVYVNRTLSPGLEEKGITNNI